MSYEKQKTEPGDILKENLSIEVSTMCNHRCSHCFARAGISAPLSLSFETVREILDEGYNLGYRKLHITGGEPLLWQPCIDMFDYAFEKGYKSIFCNTNGAMLTLDRCEILASYGNKLAFSVSLHGDAGLHDQICGDGTWKQTSMGIVNALEAGMKITIFATVGRSLLPKLAIFADTLFRNYPNIECLTLIQLIRVVDDIFDLSSELLTPFDFIWMVQTASLLNLYGLPVYILENPLATVTSYVLGMDRIPQAPQQHRRGRILVMANKDITLSHSTRDSFGSYTPGMLETALGSVLYRKMVASDLIICPDCVHYNECAIYGMNRPSERFRDMHPEKLYCRRVLDRAKALMD